MADFSRRMKGPDRLPFKFLADVALHCVECDTRARARELQENLMFGCTCDESAHNNH